MASAAEPLSSARNRGSTSSRGGAEQAANAARNRRLNRAVVIPIVVQQRTRAHPVGDRCTAIACGGVKKLFEGPVERCAGSPVISSCSEDIQEKEEWIQHKDAKTPSR